VPQKEVRHILGLSGGKDSTALAVLLHQEIPQMEYFFCDTHKELPETYDYLEKIKARLGIKIHATVHVGYGFGGSKRRVE
jgi:3'-phosphoadenosine 5'-phosphosulfate sulfotransferase (PAPS reductase)/FAD synthetase